jgi:hypothetical protein
MADNIDDFITEGRKLAALKTTDPASAERYAEMRGRRGQELELWKKWNDSGRKSEHLEPLMQSIQPLIRREATKRLSGLAGNIPRAGIEPLLQDYAVRAFESYKPEIGGKTGRPVQLTTHVVNSFQRITDAIAKGRNARYLPRNKLERAGEVMAAQQEFEQNNGRKPTFEELKTSLPLWGSKRGQRTEKKLKQLTNALAPEVYSGVSAFSDDTSADVDKYRSAVLLVYGQLNPLEQRFADLHYPAAGDAPQNIKQIAKQMGIPEHKVYRLRTRVDNHIAPLVRSS